MNRDRSIGFADIYLQIKITNKLIARQLKERLQQHELVALLMTTGASDQEIADILGTTAATVAATKVRLRKKANRATEAADEP